MLHSDDRSFGCSPEHTQRTHCWSLLFHWANTFTATTGWAQILPCAEEMRRKQSKFPNPGFYWAFIKNEFITKALYKLVCSWSQDISSISQEICMCKFCLVLTGSGFKCQSYIYEILNCFWHHTSQRTYLSYKNLQYPVRNYSKNLFQSDCHFH